MTAMTKTYFVSGHLNLTADEFTEHYELRLETAVREGARFVVGDAKGADSLTQLHLAHLLYPDRLNRVTVYHMFDRPRNNLGKFPERGGFKSDADRDTAMTVDSDTDIAWVRPGRESSGTNKNLLRRTSGSASVPATSIMFRPGQILQTLYNVERAFLRDFLADAPEHWSTLDVDYEPPRVERLWRQVDDTVRVYLHRIHPCETALFHPHPWPSAVHVLSGSYEMAIGYGAGEVEPPKGATAIFEAGSRYEMVDWDCWHSVRPLGGPSLSVMVTDTPWKRWSPKAPGKLKGLPPETRSELLALFRHELSRINYGALLPYHVRDL